MPPRISRNRGFTLIELMIVVVIIGILAAIAIPKFSQVSRAAKEAEARPILKQIRTLQERYYQAKDVYADDIAKLEGGTAIGGDADYYVFSVSLRGAAGFCAIATSKDDKVAGHQSMDENGAYYETNTC